MNSRTYGIPHRVAPPRLNTIDLKSPAWISWLVLSALTILGTEFASTNLAQAQELDSTNPSSIHVQASSDIATTLDEIEPTTAPPPLPFLSENTSLAISPQILAHYPASTPTYPSTHTLPPSLPQLTLQSDAPPTVSPVLTLTSPTPPASAPDQISQTETTAPNLLAQAEPAPRSSQDIRQRGSSILGTPSIQLQGVVLNQGDDFSGRARAAATYPISPNSLFGAVVDLTTGNAFSDSPVAGLRLNELYFATSPATLPNLRFVVGLMDLTSYFDRNSFAKDGASHFFNRAFQTNPALSAAGLESRIGALVNWNVTDNIELKAAGFSSSRNLGSFAIDAFAGEAGFRFGNLIVRGTFVTDRDAGRRTGFEEIFDIPRVGRLGPQRNDREHGYGVNAEYFIPNLKLGLFGRYGRYENITLGTGADTFSVGVTRQDLFMRDDRLGLAYGRQLSNDDLRRERDDELPDVLELYYDFRLNSFLRAGVTLQQRDQFSETVVGFRLKTEFDVSPRR